MASTLRDITAILALATLVWQGGAWFERIESHLRWNDARLDCIEHANCTGKPYKD